MDLEGDGRSIGGVLVYSYNKMSKVPFIYSSIDSSCIEHMHNHNQNFIEGLILEFRVRLALNVLLCVTTG